MEDESKLVDVDHKFDENKLKEDRDYVNIRNRISGLTKHVDRW